MMNHKQAATASDIAEVCAHYATLQAWLDYPTGVVKRALCVARMPALPKRGLDERWFVRVDVHYDGELMSLLYRVTYHDGGWQAAHVGL